MTSAPDPQSLAEVPTHSVSGTLRKASALWALTNSLVYKKDGTISRALLNRMDPKVAATPQPVIGVSSKDAIYDQDTKQFLRIYTLSQEQEENKKKLPLIIYFHGGGFAALDVGTVVCDSLCRLLAKACNAVVVSVNYRLAPEFRYPTAYDDSFQALRWVQSEFQRSGGELYSVADPSQCFLIGDSAGANIAHFMMVRAAQNDLGPVHIRGVILVVPFFGGAERSPYEIQVPNALFLPLWLTDWFWATFLPVGSDRDHPACNVVGPHAEDISVLSLPPILVTIGSLDIVQDWQVRYVEKLREMGKQVQVKYSNSCHIDHCFPEGMKKLTTDVAEFMKSLIS